MAKMDQIETTEMLFIIIIIRTFGLQPLRAGEGRVALAACAKQVADRPCCKDLAWEVKPSESPLAA